MHIIISRRQMRLIYNAIHHQAFQILTSAITMRRHKLYKHSISILLVFCAPFQPFLFSFLPMSKLTSSQNFHTGTENCTMLQHYPQLMHLKYKLVNLSYLFICVIELFPVRCRKWILEVKHIDLSKMKYVSYKINNSSVKNLMNMRSILHTVPVK